MILNKVNHKIRDLIAASPDSLNTLIELATALNDDFNFASTITNNIATKEPIANPTFTGTISGATSDMIGLGKMSNTSDLLKPIPTDSTMVRSALVNNTSDLLKPISTATQTALYLLAPVNNPTFTGSVSGITSNMVGLGNVSNTSDLLKPIVTLTQTALNLLAPSFNPTCTGSISGINYNLVGLGNLSNTSATATQTALNLKS